MMDLASRVVSNRNRATQKINLRRVIFSRRGIGNQGEDVSDADVSICEKSDEVIVEKIVFVNVREEGKNKSGYTMQFACTPVDLEALLVGAMFSEGIINVAADILSMKIKEDTVLTSSADGTSCDLSAQSIVIDVTVKPGLITVFLLAREQQLSLSQCQHSSFARLVVPATADLFAAIHVATIFNMMRMLHAKQQLFSAVGSTHAALLFKLAKDGETAINEAEIVAFAEDFGRHNGIDKVIGQILLQNSTILLAGCGMILSSRVSFELVSKAARAGIKFIAAVSAPSSLAISCAHYCGITLCGFVREGKLNIYTHPDRVLFL